VVTFFCENVDDRSPLESDPLRFVV
jgi:hypothetical protein